MGESVNDWNLVRLQNLAGNFVEGCTTTTFPLNLLTDSMMKGGPGTSNTMVNFLDSSNAYAGSNLAIKYWGERFVPVSCKVGANKLSCFSSKRVSFLSISSTETIKRTTTKNCCWSRQSSSWYFSSFSSPVIWVHSMGPLYNKKMYLSVTRTAIIQSQNNVSTEISRGGHNIIAVVLSFGLSC